ncbi:uncharacterized protein LOC123451975 [Hordeum vulgare subsp. vulgare]|uniref:uncharacterized protein LOC123451975 n=1 Tax=Hordeum vulgare subsp. vulgare TaxID=112509 RepID=UPI001D1A349E|nr:uncharacterized protein LOC123451975 [Hordeum vulgare subsp. vulgare]
MAAYPTRRDDPLSEKRRKAIAWSEEGEVSSPDLFTWVHHPDFLRNDCLEQARRDQESSASGPVKIPTLDRFEPPTRFHTAELFPVRESGSQAVLSAAKFLLGVSSSLDGESLRRCSGFWVGWDEETKTGLVLTSAWLIRTKDAPSGVWSGGQEYAPHAHVTVHLLNGTSAKGDLVYYQPHYDIAFLNVEVGQPIKSPSFCKKDVKFAQEVFQLGRDNSLNLRITYARAEYLNANMFERHHNVYFSSLDGHDDYNNEYDNGGLVIDLNGEVVGMVNNPERFGSFIPSSILLNCLDSWKKYRYIARPHLGMRFEAIKLLEPAHADMLWRMYDIDDGLVVTEVSKGSNAEKCGIQKGDLIECIKGECISTTIQLENLLMSICKGPSDSQNCHNAEVHISVGVFHTLKKYRRIVELTANVSDLGEVIIGRGTGVS